MLSDMAPWSISRESARGTGETSTKEGKGTIRESNKRYQNSVRVFSLSENSLT
jgi:hypothetical protein